MISEHHVSLIVTTCNLEEKGRVKCNKFWFDDMNDNESLKQELAVVGIEVKPAGVTQLSQHLTLRKFELTDSVLNV